MGSRQLQGRGFLSALWKYWISRRGPDVVESREMRDLVASECPHPLFEREKEGKAAV